MDGGQAEGGQVHGVRGRAGVAQFELEHAASSPRLTASAMLVFAIAVLAFGARWIMARLDGVFPHGSSRRAPHLQVAAVVVGQDRSGDAAAFI